MGDESLQKWVELKAEALEAEIRGLVPDFVAAELTHLLTKYLEEAVSMGQGIAMIRDTRMDHDQ